MDGRRRSPSLARVLQNATNETHHCSSAAAVTKYPFCFWVHSAFLEFSSRHVFPILRRFSAVYFPSVSIVLFVFLLVDSFWYSSRHFQTDTPCIILPRNPHWHMKHDVALERENTENLAYNLAELNIFQSSLNSGLWSILDAIIPYRILRLLLLHYRRKKNR